MFFIDRVLISIKSFYKNYNNQQHEKPLQMKQQE